MTIGLFLDVDFTLTKELIQRYYSEKLGVLEGYEEIEKLFQQRDINSDEFGRRLIKLFNEAKFNDAFAETWFQAMPLQNWTKEIMSLQGEYPVTIYLVSSGPSYYIERFAKHFKIEEGNYLCSEYVFGKDGDGKLVSCAGVNQLTKVQFVNRFINNHILTIGIGDHAEFDGPFITRCDIPILTQRNEGFLYAETLQLIPTLISKFSNSILANVNINVNIDISVLNPIEKRVLIRIGKEMSYTEIAEDLNMSRDAVIGCTRSIEGKLGIKGKKNLMVIATKLNLVE